MAIAMIWDLPRVTNAQDATVERMLSLALQLRNLDHAVPAADSPLIAAPSDNDFTWEDAEWQ